MKQLVLALLLICLPFASTCSESPTVKVDMSKRIELTAPATPDAITYAYLPQYSHTISYERHHLLINYLKDATGLNIRQVFPDTFDEHLSMIAHGKVDISFLNPVVYVKAAKLYDAQAFARIKEMDGRPELRGQIIARNIPDAPNSISECRGKRWIAVDPSSAGGYIFPLGLFLNYGLTRKDFAEVAFAPGPGGKQEKVVLAVNAGKFDIGTIRKGTLTVVGDRIDPGSIRVIAETPPYPGWLYAARQGLPEDICNKIAKAMFELDWNDPADQVILKAAGFHGIIPATDADYKAVRILTERLGMN